MASKIQVRFHLAAGENFMKWQVKEGGRVSYYDPETTNLVLFNARLRNQVGTAKKINEGANKTVCAWVECDRIELTEKPVHREAVLYNPRVAPHWRDGNHNNIDGVAFEKLVSVNRTLYTA